jgi:hypothetical protein
MSRIVRNLSVLALAVPALAAAGPPKEKPAAPAAQYQALVKIYQEGLQAYSEALGKAKTYEERLKVFDEVYPKPEKLAPRFIDLAEKFPQDPVAYDALSWIVVNCVRSPARIPARAKAVAILSRDHAQSEKLGPVCQNLANGYDEDTATLLKSILAKNPSKDVQAEACLALVQQYGRRLDIAKRLHEQPELASGYAKGLRPGGHQDAEASESGEIGHAREALLQVVCGKLPGPDESGPHCSAVPDAQLLHRRSKRNSLEDSAGERLTPPSSGPGQPDAGPGAKEAAGNDA